MVVACASFATVVASSALQPPHAWAATQSYWQVGAASSDSTDEFAQGAASYLGHIPLPQSEPNGAAVFIWVGDNLADGSFVQSGYETNDSSCKSQMGEFAAAFDNVGHWILNLHVACGITISGFAQFSFFRGNEQPTGQWQWLFAGATGTLPGSSYYAYASDTGTNKPSSVAELSICCDQTIASNSQLGPVGADPALQTEFGSGWAPTLSAVAYYGYAAKCPPTNVIPHGTNWVSFGTGLTGSCHNGGTSLW